MENASFIKTYEQKVDKVLRENLFVVEEKDKSLIKERIENGRRYFYIVLPRIENGQKVERFLKIPCRNIKKLLEPFDRQLLMAEYLQKNNVILTRGVVASRIDHKKGIPFAIMDTFPVSHSRIGFIDGFKKAEELNEIHAKNVIHALNEFHSVDISNLPPQLQKIIKKYKDDYKSLRRDFGKYLNKKVKPIDGTGEELFHKVLGRRLQISNLRQKIISFLEILRPIIFDGKNKGGALIHGDMAPNNLYIYDNDDVELLDLEWVGYSDNKAMAMVIDFGNLRGRSWNNDVFRNALDEYLLKSYEDMGKKELGQAIVSLAILRSHLMLAGFFENYAPEKQSDEEQKLRREKTEQDIKKAWNIMSLSF